MEKGVGDNCAVQTWPFELVFIPFGTQLPSTKIMSSGLECPYSACCFLRPHQYHHPDFRVRTNEIKKMLSSLNVSCSVKLTRTWCFVFQQTLCFCIILQKTTSCGSELGPTWHLRLCLCLYSGKKKKKHKKNHRYSACCKSIERDKITFTLLKHRFQFQKEKTFSYINSVFLQSSAFFISKIENLIMYSAVL